MNVDIEDTRLFSVCVCWGVLEVCGLSNCLKICTLGEFWRLVGLEGSITILQQVTLTHLLSQSPR